MAKYLSNQGQFNIKVSSRKLECLPEGLRDCVIVKIDNNTTKEELNNILTDVDIVIHLAALNEIDCILYPDEAIMVNVLGLNKMLNASISAGVKKFIYFSTAHIYCSPLIGNISESNFPIPLHPYSITHKAAEDYIIAATLQNKIDGIVVRLSNSIGAPLHSGINRWTLLVNDLCKQIVETGEIHLKTSGVQIRNFITMDDLCRATEHICNFKSYDKLFPVYNLGGPSNLSINEMTKMVVDASIKIFKNSPIVFKPEALENSHALNYYSTKFAKTGFVWNNAIEKEIEETLIAAFKFFRD